MAVNKIKYADETLMDLTDDTVTSGTLLSGVTAHASNGERITGTAEIPTKLSQLDGEMTEAEKAAVRSIIGAGASGFSGDYNDLINKPIWKEGAKAVIFNSEIAIGSNGVYAQEGTLENISAGDIVHVIWDDFECDCEVKNSPNVNGGYYFGYDLYDESYSGSEPFTVASNPTQIMIIATDRTAGTHSIKIYKQDGENVVYHKLENEYLNLDSSPTENSGNPITSGGVYKANVEILAIANGKCKSYVFDTVSDLDTWLGSSSNTSGLKTGDVFLIRAVNVPDYWWDGTTGSKQILETTKVDLSTYALKADIPATLPANGGNADTVDGKHIVVSSSVPTNNDTSIITFVI